MTFLSRVELIAEPARFGSPIHDGSTRAVEKAEQIDPPALSEEKIRRERAAGYRRRN